MPERRNVLAGAGQRNQTEFNSMCSPLFNFAAPLGRVRLIVPLIAGLAGITLGAAPQPAEPWIDQLKNYAAQQNLEHDRPYSDQKPPALRWTAVLKTLPEPGRWPALHAQLSAAATGGPEGVERQRLQAGSWLLGYLLGRKDEVLAGLPPMPADQAESTPAAYVAENLRQILSASTAEETSLEQQMRSFEEQLAMLEPVDMAAVKQAIGGEENLARLHRVVEAGKVMRGRAMEVYEEFEKTKDEAVARRKMEELEKEFVAAHGADQTALEAYQQDPVIGRYVQSLYQQDMADDYVPSLELPDLVKAVGAERAEALLLRALHLPVRLGASVCGETTAQLARKLALAEVARLKVACWGLTQHVEAAGLFEALQARFGEPKEKDYDYQRARGYYLAALILRDRVPEAVQLAGRLDRGGSLELPYEVLDALERGGHAGSLWQFLREWLGRHPAATEWDRFNRLSAQLDRQDELKEFIRSLAEQGAFAGMDRLRVQRMQADVELATDDLAAADKRLRSLVVAPAKSAEELDVQMDICDRLIQLADLQGDQNALAATLAAAEPLLQKCRALQAEKALDLAATLTTALNTAGRLTEGERISREALQSADNLKKAAGGEQTGHVSSYTAQNLVREQLRALTGLERWADAARLVEESPWWGAGDAGQLLAVTIDSDRKPLGVHFAQVALKQGQTGLARKLLEAELVAAPGADSGYESYLALVGQEARPLLAKLAAIDRYQERPLIWQAKLHLEAKELDQAVAALEAAIAIDPSDGEQGRGDRMRVYALMAQAQAARGDAAKAVFFEGVVKAIRLSETADRWFNAGAYARAIRLYRESLGFFQDAYCIQSRLAVRLAGEGRMDEAADYYRKAFELMPDSFGRVESHCFGCEHVFAGEKSQGVAEEVFTKMLAARPDKPQLHYLMGYLREEQKRPSEAAELYRKAVQLDPLYLNAWSKLAGLEQELKFTPQQRDDLMLKLLELDPSRRHASPDLARVSDLARLWHGLAAAERALQGLPATDNLWALKASAAALSANGESRVFTYQQLWKPNFGTVLGENAFIQTLQQYLAALNARPEEE
jgi:tetratricopeptide (TPR) repeat protein